MSKDERLPWIRVDLLVENIKTDEKKLKTLYLYEEDWRDIQEYIASKKTNCTTLEASQLFEYLWDKNRKLLEEFGFTEEEKINLDDSLSNSKYLNKAMEELIKNKYGTLSNT